jgi:hypothetical protein
MFLGWKGNVSVMWELQNAHRNRVEKENLEALREHKSMRYNRICNVLVISMGVNQWCDI